MMNFRINSGIVLISIVLFALAGCKKEEESASFEITGTKSLHFEYGQEKQIKYKAHRVASFDAPVPPFGWTCTVDKQAGVIKLTAPEKSNTGASLMGYVTIKCYSDTGSALAKELEIEVKVAEEITDHANSFIVKKSNQRYKFDGRVRGNESSASMSPADAVLVWTSAVKGVNHVSLEDGYVYFATGDALDSNSMIAVVDQDDKVLWSWHIWATNYDPAASPDAMEGELVMNRNLGAFASSGNSVEDAFNSHGLYYQWGRKDPFVGSAAWNSTIQQQLYNSNSLGVAITFEESSAATGKLEYAIANPTVFLTGTTGTNFDWLYASRDNTLWGNANSGTGATSSRGDKKALQDPCPAGWKVAPPYIWKSFTTTGKASSVESEFNVVEGEGEYLYGWTFTDGTAQVYYPGAGRRSFAKAKGNFTNVVNDEEEVGHSVGFYWSNSNSSATEAAVLAFRKDYVNPGMDSAAGSTGSAEGARAGGFPVRCVTVDKP